MNGLLDLFEKLKKEFNGEFVITKEVEYEVIRRPLRIKKFELGALRIQKLVENKTIVLPEAIGIKSSEIDERAKYILEKSNKTFYARDKYIHLIDRGEASCIALSQILTKKEVKNVIAIDERTTRMLYEKPENLHKLLETKLHANIKSKKENLKEFQGVEFIRSCELVFIAYKKGLIDLKGENVLDALLYAVKYKGCSVSRNEIEEMKRL